MTYLPHQRWLFTLLTVSGSAGNMANCLEIEPYMFEPVCQSGESESSDSHADTDSDSDTDGDMYRGLAHQPVQLWCECTK